MINVTITMLLLSTVLSTIALVSTLLGQGKIRSFQAKVSILEAENQTLRQQLLALQQTQANTDTRLSKLEAETDKVKEKVEALSDLALRGEGRGGEPQGEREGEKSEEEDLVDLKIIVLHKQGYSIRRIAKELGIPKSTVHKRLKKLMGKMEKSNHQTPDI